MSRSLMAGAMAGMVVLSTGPRSSLLAPGHLGAGLFTNHLVRGLRRSCRASRSRCGRH